LILLAYNNTLSYQLGTEFQDTQQFGQGPAVELWCLEDGYNPVGRDGVWLMVLGEMVLG